eukprot:6185521-Alexandrium_andersonii.AAC.1
MVNIAHAQRHDTKRTCTNAFAHAWRKIHNYTTSPYYVPYITEYITKHRNDVDSPSSVPLAVHVIVVMMLMMLMM